MKPPADPPVYVALPFFRRLRLRVRLWMIKTIVPCYMRWIRYQSSKRPADQRPMLVKKYADSPLPNREVRVFIPHTYKSGDPPLPLLIDIHGGGFCIGAPELDEKDNVILCHQYGFCVVSIPYRLAPTYRFPTAPMDCAGMIKAVLNDESLPVDRSNVAVIGYSAGGNLSLTGVLALEPELRTRIKGIVAYYPVVDQVTDFGIKKQRQTLAPDGKDILHEMAPMFNAAYIVPGMKKDNPLLSPIFAPREDLPPKIFLLGCEYDVLCIEAEEMAEDLATHETGEKKPLTGGRNGWSKGGVQWELIEKVVHGFHQQPYTGEKARQAHETNLKMQAGVVEWLKSEVFT